MKASQKGTRLNDVRCFRQPRPYTRKRITKMRVISDLPGLHGCEISSPKERKLLSKYPRSSEKSRDRCITLDCDQRSREIAWISYTSDSDDSENSCGVEKISRSDYRDTFVGTDPEKEIIVHLPESLDFTSEDGESGKFGTKLEMEKEVQVELELQVEEKNTGVDELVDDKNIRVEEIVNDENIGVEEFVNDQNIGVEEIVKEENNKAEKSVKELMPVVLVRPEKRKESSVKNRREIPPEKPEVRSSKNSSSSEKSSWLRYASVRKILEFFGHFLGKRENEDNQKEDTQVVEDRRLIKNDVNNSSNGAKNPEFSINSRAKRSTKRKHMPTRKNTGRNEPDDLAVSGLTRQIMNTRDKRLRTALIEHEIRTRKLEEENKRYRKIFQEKLKTRQMSSPLH